MYLVFFNEDNIFNFNNESFDYMSDEEMMRQLMMEYRLSNISVKVFDFSEGAHEFFYNWQGDAKAFESYYNGGILDSGWWCRVIYSDGFMDMCEGIWNDVCNEVHECGEICVGCKVRWNDPEIEDFEPEDRDSHLGRIYDVVQIDGTEDGPAVLGSDDEHFILISDGFSETEVFANELKRID